MSPRPYYSSLLALCLLVSGCGEVAFEADKVRVVTAPKLADNEPPIEAIQAPKPEPLPPLATTLTSRERAVLERVQESLASPLPRAVPKLDDMQGGGQRSDPVEPSALPLGLSASEQAAIADDPAATAFKAPPSSTPSAATNPSQVEVLPVQGVKVNRVAGALNLTTLAIAEAVVGRSPVNPSTHYASAPSKLHCYCVFENRGEPTMVTHIWRRDGKIVSRVELEVGRSPKWRTWSRQRLPASAEGRWSCEVIEGQQDLKLGTVTVSVGGG